MRQMIGRMVMSVASNLLSLRKSAGYKSAGDFAVAHGIPVSTYTRYESNPDKIPMDRAWQLADILGTSIDAIVGREAPAPGTARGEIQLEYDGLTPEARALADEFREFVLSKDEKFRARRRREDDRRYEALCYQYEHQMLAELRADAAFGEVVDLGSADEARETFLAYLQGQAARKRGELAPEAQKAVDDKTIEKIMEAYDRAHGEFEFEGMSVMWSTVEHGSAVEYDSAFRGREGDAMA